MLHRSRSKDYSAGDAAPRSAYFSRQQTADFLTDLRNNRPARPSGSRPPPSSSPTRRSMSKDDTYKGRKSTSSRSSFDLTHSRSSSVLSYYQGAGSVASGRSSPDKMFYAAAQRDMEQREGEKEEALRMRMALASPTHDDDYYTHSAAQREAAELIWKHQNPHAPYHVQPSRQKLLREEQSPAAPAYDIPADPAQYHDMPERASREDMTPRATRIPDASPERSPTRRLGSRFSMGRMSTKRRSITSLRNVSGTIKKAVFPNSKEQIWEDGRSPTKESPEKLTDVDKMPVHARRNPFARAQAARQNQQSGFDRSDVIRSLKNINTDRDPNRWNPGYTSNASPALSSPEETTKPAEVEHADQEVRYKDGIEVRSDDIRAATSMRRKDRSPRLPSPTVVSDNPSRPIVSFNDDWQPPEVEQSGSPTDPDAFVPEYSPHVKSQEPPQPTRTTTSAPSKESRTHPVSAKGTSFADRAGTQVTSYGYMPRGASSPTRTASPESEMPPARRAPSKSPTLPLATTHDGTVAEVPRIGVNGESRESRKKPFRSQTDPPPQASDHTVRAIPKINAGMRQPATESGLSRSDTAPTVPTVNVNSAPAEAKPRSSRANVMPSVQVSEPDATDAEPRRRPSRPVMAPSVQVSEPEDMTAPRPRPQGRSRTGRQNPIDLPQVEPRSAMRHAETAPASVPRGHWTPATRNNGALCAQCALPISGRIVTAAGTRFHPECFTCYHCREALECVAFYPEPTSSREERIERMQRRMEGEEVEPPQGVGMEEDNDDSLRFYCHLDFHEFFSPRCKSCKTPIEGEIIVACGAEWHMGHFFCAECGDPFSPSVPFVEKDGYAWCINCHTNRSSTRCKKCKKPVTDTVLKALGADWHDECFRCFECDSTFQDGKFFLRGSSQDPVCSGCEARRLKG